MVTQKFERSELHQTNLLTIKDGVDWAKVSTKNVYRWISNNKIPAIRLASQTYRISERTIIAYLKQIGYEHLVE